jgi:hypothetical protein
MYIYANVDKLDNVQIYTLRKGLSISHLLQSVHMDMCAEKRILTALLLPQNNNAMNHCCCIPNDASIGTYHD